MRVSLLVQRYSRMCDWCSVATALASGSSCGRRCLLWVHRRLAPRRAVCPPVGCKGHPVPGWGPFDSGGRSSWSHGPLSGRWGWVPGTDSTTHTNLCSGCTHHMLILHLHLLCFFFVFFCFTPPHPHTPAIRTGAVKFRERPGSQPSLRQPCSAGRRLATPTQQPTRWCAAYH